MTKRFCSFVTRKHDSDLVREVKAALNSTIPPEVWTDYWQRNGLKGRWDEQPEDTLYTILYWVESIRANPLLMVLNEIEESEDEHEV